MSFHMAVIREMQEYKDRFPTVKRLIPAVVNASIYSSTYTHVDKHVDNNSCVCLKISVKQHRSSVRHKDSCTIWCALKLSGYSRVQIPCILGTWLWSA